MSIRLLSRLHRDASSSLACGAKDSKFFLFRDSSMILVHWLLSRLCRDASSSLTCGAEETSFFIPR